MAAPCTGCGGAGVTPRGSGGAAQKTGVLPGTWASREPHFLAKPGYKKAERCCSQQSQQDTRGHPAPGTAPGRHPVAHLKSLGRDKLRLPRRLMPAVTRGTLHIIPCLVVGKESLHKGATTGHGSSHLQHFCLPKKPFSVGYCPIDSVSPRISHPRGHSKPHASAPTVFANSRFIAFGCKPQSIQGLPPQDP